MEATANVTCVEQVTVEWLAWALRNPVSMWEGPTDFVKIEKERIGEGEGFLGSLFRISLHSASGDTPSFVIAKFAPVFKEDDELFQRFFKPLNLFERETQFYKAVAPLLCDSGTVPKCYFSSVDREIGKGVLLLEDITHSLGGQVCNFAEGLSLSKTKAVLDALANLHSLHFNVIQESIPPGPEWALTRNLPVVQDMAAAFYEFALDSFKNKFATALSEQVWAKCEKLRDYRSPPCMTASARCVTLIHGDLWSSNLLFHERKGPTSTDRTSDGVVLIDWQFVGWDSPLLDVCFLFHSSLDPTLRRENEEELLKHYHAELTRHLLRRAKIENEQAYDWNKCRADYEEAKLATFFQNLASFDMYVVENTEDAETKQAKLLGKLTGMINDFEQQGILDC